ncbi:MAG: hypothetical protein AB7E37_07730 [Candidatus Altimarinota bacterium]
MKKDELQQIDPTETQKSEIALYMKKARSNKLTLGADLVEVTENVGKEIVDKETKRVKTDEEGEPLRYKSKYYAKFDFMGGQIETEIKEADFKSLSNNIGMPYYLEGRMSVVKIFGEENIAPVFSKFELLA